MELLHGMVQRSTCLKWGAHSLNLTRVGMDEAEAEADVRVDVEMEEEVDDLPGAIWSVWSINGPWAVLVRLWMPSNASLHMGFEFLGIFCSMPGVLGKALAATGDEKGTQTWGVQAAITCVNLKSMLCLTCPSER